MNRLLVRTAGLCLLCAACNQPGARLNAPPHGPPYETHDMQGTFVFMADNGLLADMTVSDIHFLPHRTQLSSLGRERLTRLASLMESYGGTIRLNTDLTDEELIERRTETIIDFLAAAGIDATADVVARDLPGGRGMDAREVILIKVDLATYQPKSKNAQSGAIQAKPGL